MGRRMEVSKMAPNYVMMVGLMTLIWFSLCFGDDMIPISNHLIAKPNCKESCGNVSIPFPFGLTRDCSLNKQFLVNCNYSFQPPQPFLRNTSIEITSISLAGQLDILQFISRDCYSGGLRTEYKDPWIRLQSFTVNDTVNKFIAVGCDTYAIVRGFYRKNNSEISDSYITGCMSMCKSIDDAVNGDNNICSGVGCCQTSIPNGAWNVNITLSSYYNHTNLTNNPSCSYAFVVKEDNFSFSKSYLSRLHNTRKLPLVLDWSIGEETCEIATRNSTTYACKSNNSDCHDNSIGYRCCCKQGYHGNPYLTDGCQDIDECKDDQKPADYRCAKDAICQNTEGNYTCKCLPDFSGDGTVCNHHDPQGKTHNVYLVIGVTLGVAFMVIIVLGWSYTRFQRRNMLMMKKLFQENGGLVLQQRLTGEDGSSNTNTVKIFSAEELEKATNDFDKDRVIGQGGYGTVYKGYLKDNLVVAIKKSKVIDRNQIEQFINEVLVLSQINHRNVVKLLGCCLETEVPLLVYEFINNGTLSEHLHDELIKGSTLSLDIRMRIAAETAGVLSYLHSAAYPPIIHRDIKSVNILLDKSYTAKVSDFGASRLVPADQTELSTLVQGTLGYLDPEYLQTNQLTEKSDVYSFGVVLVELLTGRKALCFNRPEEERSLSQYFISSVEKGHLFDILDDNIVCDERNAGQLKNVALLAQRCLNVKGDDRPTMKEVATELEAGSRLKHSWAQIDQHTEEVESLLHGSQPLGFGYEYSEHNICIDSITSHVTLSFPGGR